MKFLRALFGKRPPAISDEQRALNAELAHWSVAKLTNPELGISVIRLRDQRPALADLAEYRTCVRVTWPYETPNGLPDQVTSAAQAQFDETLEPLTSDNGFAYRIMVLTGMNVKKWVFYTTDAARFSAELKLLTEPRGELPLVLEVSHDPEWAFWRDIQQSVAARVKEAKASAH